MTRFYKVHIRDLVPASDGESSSHLVSPQLSAFFGQNPFSETCTVPGSANATLKELSAMDYGDNPQALQYAQVLYAAWLNFYRGNLRQAQDAVLDLFERIRVFPQGPVATLAQKLGAAYLICNLARYGMPRYRTDEAVAFMLELSKGELCVSQAAAINLAMHEMSLGIMSDVPSWIRTADFGVARTADSLLFEGDGVRPENLYAAVTAAAQYANYRGDYVRSLNIMDIAEQAYGMQGYLIVDAYFALYRALNFEALGFPDDADACLCDAVHLVQPDGLWQIVSQFVPSFGERLVKMVEGVDAEGAIQCNELSKGFIDRLQASHDEEKELRGHQKLTNQELAVMRLLAQGKMGTEVARELCVEPVTVKFHKKNAVRKLGIRATANVVEIQEAPERYEISAAWIR